MSKERFLTARSSDEGGGDGGSGGDDGSNADGFVAVALSPNPSTRSLRLNEFFNSCAVASLPFSLVVPFLPLGTSLAMVEKNIAMGSVASLVITW